MIYHINEKSIAICIENALCINTKSYDKNNIIFDVKEECLFLKERMQLLNQLLAQITKLKNKDPTKIWNIINIFKSFFDLDNENNAS